MAVEDNIIGKGWGFPVRFNYQQSDLEMSSGIQDIHESLYIIFTTSLGERLMQPKFGCSLQSMQMEPMNNQALGYIDNLLRSAILYHEPRIDAQNIHFDITTQPGTLYIDIEYVVRGTNSRFNYVYPFYVNEVRGE
jgi:phage baseplate assembly protein W